MTEQHAENDYCWSETQVRIQESIWPRLPCPTCLAFDLAFLLAPERLRARRAVELVGYRHLRSHGSSPARGAPGRRVGR